MASTDVLGYLQSKGWQPKASRGYEYHGPCFFHGEDQAERGRLYVNCDPGADILGLFDCKVCGEKGALPTIMRFFGDEPGRDDSGDEDPSEVRLEILRITAAFYHELLGDHDDVFAYLRGPERGLSGATIIDRQIGYAPLHIEQDLGEESGYKRLPSTRLYHHLRDLGYPTKELLATGVVFKSQKSDRIYDSLSGMITIPYMASGNVVQIRGRAWPYDKKKDAKLPKYKTCGGNAARLFNSDVTWDHDEVCVTEGEFDALVLEQLGFPAVGVPGAGTWQDTWDGYVTGLRRMFIVFDRDQAGEQGVEKLKAKFGAKARPIWLSPEGIKTDPTSWVAKGGTAEEFSALIRKATRGALLVSVDEAIEEHRAQQGRPGLQFGVELLDAALRPGIQPAQLVIVLAKTGTGKTIYLLNMMQRMSMVPGQEDTTFLFLSLEQTRGEWWERARRIHRFYNLDIEDDVEAERAARDFWADRMMLVDRNRLTPDDIKSAVDDFDQEMGKLPDVICLDYIGYFAQSFKGERYERTGDAVMACKEIVKDLRVRMIAPHQVNRGAKDGEEFGTDAARDSGAIEETADFLFNIWSPDNTLARSEGEKQGIIKQRIAKSRNGPRGLLLDYRWGPLSLVMVPTGDPRSTFAADELEYASPGRRETWEEAVWRHRTGFKGAVHRPGHTYQQTGTEDF